MFFKVHTSPPAYSLNRVMAGFRTRSQIMLDHIEEEDEVLHCCFSDHSDEDERHAKNRKRRSFRYFLYEISIFLGAYGPSTNPVIFNFFHLMVH